MKAGKDYIGVGCGAIILNDRGKILLVKRKNLGEDRTTANMWSVPGGEVKFGEKVEDAIIREAKEEVGVDVEIIQYIGYHNQILKASRVHWHSNAFLCKIKKGRPKIMEKDKIEDIKWFSTSKLPKHCGIAHIVSPLYKLDLINKKEHEKRLKETPES